MRQLASKQRVTVRSLSWQQCGSVAVESALILPVLLAAVAATIVIGLRLSDQMYLAQSARELGVVLSRVPYMAALKGPGGADSYTLSLSYVGNETEQSTDASLTKSYLEKLDQGSLWCGSATSNYSDGTVSGVNCTTMARHVSKWYAKQVLILKRMFVNDSLTLRVSYVSPAADGQSSTGVCMIKVDITATSTGWLSWATGSIVVSQSVPYVSSPVPDLGRGCCPGTCS